MENIKNIDWQEIKNPTGCNNVNEKLNNNINNIDSKIEQLLAEIAELREKRDKVSLYETVYKSADERVINALKVLRDTINFVNYTNGQVGQAAIAEQYNETLLTKINNMALLIGEDPIVDEIPDEWLLNESDDISDIPENTPEQPEPPQPVDVVEVVAEVIPNNVEGLATMGIEQQRYDTLKRHLGDENMTNDALMTILKTKTRMNNLTFSSIERLAIDAPKFGQKLFDNGYWSKSTSTLNELITQNYGHEAGQITKVLKESYGFSNKVARVLYLLTYVDSAEAING